MTSRNSMASEHTPVVPSDEQIDILFEDLFNSGLIGQMPTYTEGRCIARHVLALSHPAVLVEPGLEHDELARDDDGDIAIDYRHGNAK